MNDLRKIFRAMIGIGLFGIVGIFVYAIIFDGNRFLPLFYGIFLFVTVAGVGGVTTSRLIHINAAIERRENSDGLSSQRKRLFWLGLVLNFSPIPLLFLVHVVFGAPSNTGMLLTFMAALLLLTGGICLMFSSYLEWYKAARRLK